MNSQKHTRIQQYLCTVGNLPAPGSYGLRLETSISFQWCHALVKLVFDDCGDKKKNVLKEASVISVEEEMRVSVYKPILPSE